MVSFFQNPFVICTLQRYYKKFQGPFSGETLGFSGAHRSPGSTCLGSWAFGLTRSGLLKVSILELLVSSAVNKPDSGQTYSTKIQVKYRPQNPCVRPPDKKYRRPKHGPKQSNKGLSLLKIMFMSELPCTISINTMYIHT